MRRVDFRPGMALSIDGIFTMYEFLGYEQSWVSLHMFPF